MSSVCGGLDFKDAECHLESNSASSSNGSKHVSCVGSEDGQESDGDDSGYIPQCVNEESNDKLISEPIAESLPLNKSLDDEGEAKNLANALQDMFSEDTSEVTIIPAIKGSREKYGKSLVKLSVSWAEDVYDPTPSIVSHTRSKKQQQPKKSKDNVKKNGKKGQKGSSTSPSSSRGSKDKKKSSRSKNSCDKFGWATQMPIVAASS